MVLYFVAAVTMLSVRYLILPQVNEWRPLIERYVSASLGVPLKIGNIDASWSGLNPTLKVSQLEIRNDDGQPLLSVPDAFAVVSWRSLFLMQPRFAFLELNGVSLSAIRHENGDIFVAGKRLDGDTAPAQDSWRDVPAINWLLKQNKIVLHKASFEWRDLYRKAPDLVLSNIDIAVENGLISHRLLVSLDPPGELGERLELVVRSDDIIHNLGAGTHANRQAEVYVLLQDFEPDAWSPWVDLPYDFSGRYSLRLWSDVVKGKLTHTTVDFAGNQAGRPPLAGGGIGGHAARFSVRMTGWVGDILPQDFASGLFQHSPEFSGVNVNLSAAGVTLETEWLDPATVNIDTLSGDLLIKRSQLGRFSVSLTSMSLANHDLNASLQGSWQQDDKSALGTLQLQGAINQLDATNLYRYLSTSIEPETRQWFRDSIHQGVFPQLTLLVNGNLDAFPFNMPGSTGRFQLSGPFKNLTIDYAPGVDGHPGWPLLSGLNGVLSIDKTALNIKADNGMLISANDARLPIQNLVARIPDMDVDPVLTLTAGLRADAAEFIGVVNGSALQAHVGSYIEDMSASGMVDMPLSLAVDLAQPENTRFQSSLNFTGATFKLPGNIPDIDQLRGILELTNDRVVFQDIRARFMGGEVKVSGDLGKDAKGFRAEGSIGIDGLRKEIPSKALGAFKGNTRYRLQSTPRPAGGFDLLLTSTLQGIQIDLPEPIGKQAQESMPLSIRWTQVPGQKGAQENLILGLGDILNARFERNQAVKNSSSYFQRGMIGVGFTPIMPANGLTVDVQMPALDWDNWSSFMDDLLEGSSNNKTNKKDNNRQTAMLPPIARIHLKVEDFDWSDIDLTNLDVSATQTQPGSWSVRMSSKETVGTISWKEASGTIAGRVVAQFSRLAFGSPEAPETPAQAHAVTEGQWSDIPAIDVTIEDFTLYGNRLGTVKILGTNLERGKRWSLENLEVQNPHARLKSQGELRLSGENRGLAMKAKLDIEDLGKLSDFMGMPDRVKEGKGSLEAEVDWLAFPWIYSYAGLSGKARVNLEQGVFVHVNSKSARLLELLSIQSLQRLFKLDFRPGNEFEGGFPFTSITGDLNLKQGIAYTNNLTIRSPIAEIMMNGNSNMVSKSWDMRANVKPIFDMSGAAIATGFAVNPLVGLSALVTQFLLRTPLERAMTARYKVTGSWDDPKLDPLADKDVAPDSGEKSAEQASGNERAAPVMSAPLTGN